MKHAYAVDQLYNSNHMIINFCSLVELYCRQVVVVNVVVAAVDQLLLLFIHVANVCCS